MPRGRPRIRTKDGKINLVGSRVYEYRRALKLTQDALCGRLAHATGGEWIADRQDIHRIENGIRIVSDLELIALAKALECSTDALLFGK